MNHPTRRLSAKPPRRPAPPRPRAITLACLGLLATLTAQAQTANPGEPVPESVTVTGTLIRGARTVGSPVLGLSRQDIESAPASTTTDLLRQLPQIANLGASDTHFGTAQNANQNVTAGSGINLRGLGPESTLVLLSGRRLAPGGVAGQYTDPSAIPPLAIERMEVLTDGASATYGSDAVGGVVNLRLRRSFTGVDAVLRYGSADGLTQKQAGAIGGFQWASGSAMVAVDRHERTALSADERAFYTDDLRAWGGPDLRAFFASPGNVQLGAVRYAIPSGQNGVGLLPSQLVAGTSRRQSIHKGVSALPAQERSSAVFTVVQDLSDNITLSLEGFWSERQFDRFIEARSGNLTVRNTNPFFVSPTGSSSVVVNYSFFGDMGASKSGGFERSQQVAAVLDFGLPGRWKGNAHISHSVTQNRNLIDSLNNNAVNAALADTNPATALNLFCDGAAFRCNNPATVAGLLGYQDRNAKFTMVDLAVRADGPLFSLPAGALRMAVGAEVHRDKLPYFLINNTTGPTVAVTRYVDNAAFNPERDVKSVFAELNAPLVSPAMKVPGVERLDLALAGRAEHYSDFGATRNPKAGISWVPVSGLELRGTYSRAFRAPTMGDIDPVNGSAVNVVDRVDAGGATSLRGILYLGGNNAGLKPETAVIKTLGLSFKPAMVPGLTASLDFFDIDYRNRILTPGNDVTVLQRPELAAYVNRNPTAAQVEAAKANPVYSGSATEPVAGIRFIIDGRRQNAGAVRMAGSDVALRWVTPSPVGQITAGLAGTYISKYEQQFTPSTPLVTGLLNTLNNPLRWRARGELGWARDNLGSVTAFVNHSNRYTNTTLATRPEVASSTTIDLSARLSLARWLSGALAKDVALSVSVVNLTDKDPPYVQNGTLAFDPQNASSIGRMVSIAINGRW